MSENPSHLETIFFEALEIEDQQPRAEYLVTRCGVDSELRRKVEELLVANAEMSQFLNKTQAFTPRTEPNDFGSSRSESAGCS